MKKSSFIKYLILPLFAGIMITACSNGSGSPSKQTDNSKETPAEEPEKEIEYEAFPVYSEGDCTCKIEGAGIWIFIDTDITGNITAGTAADMTVSISGANVISKTYDYPVPEGKPRLFIALKEALTTTSVNVNLKGKINGKYYEGTVKFLNNLYLPDDYTVTELVVFPATKNLRSGETVTFSVYDKVYGLEQQVTWSISPETGTISDKGVYTAPASIPEDTQITVTATYSEAVKQTTSITLISDSTEKPAYSVTLPEKLNANFGKFLIAWEDDSYAIAAASESIITFTIGTNAMIIEPKPALETNDSNEKSVYATLYTLGAEWSSKDSQAFTLTVQAASGAIYTISGTLQLYTSSGEVEDITVTQVKQLTASKTDLAFITALNEQQSVTISQTGIEDFDAANLTVSVSDSEVISAAFDTENPLNLSVTCLKDGEAQITVAYGEDYTISIDVFVSIGSTGVNWAKIDFVGNGTEDQANTDAYKFYACDGIGSAINIQIPDWSLNTENEKTAGIYATFDSGISSCSLGEEKEAYKINGAGISLFLSSFTKKETTFTVTTANGTYNCIVYFANGI